jgi:hypothetical protein
MLTSATINVGWFDDAFYHAGIGREHHKRPGLSVLLQSGMSFSSVCSPEIVHLKR